MISFLRNRLNLYSTKMTKNYCDVCEKELTKEELGGQLVYLEKTFSMKLGDNPQPPQIEQVNKLLCEKCLEKVKKAIKI